MDPYDIDWSKLARLTDPTESFEMYANGHPKFLTKAMKKKLLEAGVESIQGFNVVGGEIGGDEEKYEYVSDLEADYEDDHQQKRKRPSSKWRKLRSKCSALSEPYSEFNFGI